MLKAFHSYNALDIRQLSKITPSLESTMSLLFFWVFEELHKVLAPIKYILKSLTINSDFYHWITYKLLICICLRNYFISLLLQLVYLCQWDSLWLLGTYFCISRWLLFRLYDNLSQLKTNKQQKRLSNCKSHICF